MKKILIALILTIFSFTGFSQISGGLFVGPNLSWFGVDSKVQSSEGVRLGYTFGATADFPFSDNFLFTAAIKYNDLGGTMKYKNGALVHLYDEAVPTLELIGNNQNIEYNLQYLELPIGFKGKTNEIGFLSYFMKAGVTPMITLKGKADITAGSNDLFTKNMSFFNFNWFMGGGFEWSLTGNTRFFAEIVYTGGIADFIKDEFRSNDSDLQTTVSPIDDFEHSDRYESFDEFEDTFDDVKDDYEDNPDNNSFEGFIDDNSKIIRTHRGKTNAIELKIGILF
ncbi:MAG: porin family protein [Bacteroidota bacterium]